MRTWQLIGADGQPFQSKARGEFGGHRKSKVYGRLDCRSALRERARRGLPALRGLHAGPVRSLEID